MGQMEFGDNGIYNTHFWNNQVEYCSGEKLTRWLNLAEKIPTCLLVRNQRLPHTTGLFSLANCGPMISEDFLYMTLYGGYCSALCHFMNLDVTIHAHSYGFCPLFLITNTLVQRSSWGFCNTCLVCCDCGAISVLSMIGFWRQNSDNSHDDFLLGLNVNALPLTSNILVN